MKRLFAVLLAGIFFHSFIVAQIIGGFNIANDGHIYFQAMNNTMYNYQISIVAESSDNHNSEKINVGSGSGFYLGPSTPWRWFWKKGDRITVIYPNGQNQSWVCPQSDRAYNSNGVSFKGKHCTGTVGCSCSGFKPITDGDVWQESYCARCGHHKKYHR